MPQTSEQVNERTHLLLHAANDRRLSHIQHEDAESLLSSRVSKAEQALSATPVGERLPYNDYTTIDWLHDLVQSLLSSTKPSQHNDSHRSKTLSVLGQFGHAKDSAMVCYPSGIPAKDGSLQQSSAFSQPAWPFWSMLLRLPSVTGSWDTAPRTCFVTGTAVAPIDTLCMLVPKIR